MIVIGLLSFEVILGGKVPRLKIHARPYSYDTLATEEELLALSVYLEREVNKLRDEKERR